MDWIDATHTFPETGQPVLAVVLYLNAPFEDGGYNDAKAYWMRPRRIVTMGTQFDESFVWDCGGNVTHWMPIPNLPKEE